MFCMQCGAKADDHATFCARCGAKLAVPPPADAPAFDTPAAEAADAPIIRAPGQDSTDAPIMRAPGQEPLHPDNGAPAFDRRPPNVPPLYAAAPPPFTPPPVPPRKRKNGAIAVPILGVLAVLMTMFGSGGRYLAIVLGAAGLITAIVLLTRKTAAAPSRKPLCGAGSVLSAIAIVLAIVMLAATAGDYRQAVAQMESGDYAGAEIAFLELGGYKDAQALASLCNDTRNYEDATALMAAGDHEGALLLFDGLYGFKDSEELAEECQNHLDYAEAKALKEDKQYYDAYQLFLALGDFEDSAKQAESCIQDYPKTGVVKRADAYKKDFTYIEFSMGRDDAPVFVKVYDAENGEFAASVFVRPGAKGKVYLPRGTYEIKFATGEDWFGPDDMFGDAGDYQICDEYTDVADSNYYYTWEFLVDDGEVDSNLTTPDDF